MNIVNNNPFSLFYNDILYLLFNNVEPIDMVNLILSNKSVYSRMIHNMKFYQILAAKLMKISNVYLTDEQLLEYCNIQVLYKKYLKGTHVTSISDLHKLEKIGNTYIVSFKLDTSQNVYGTERASFLSRGSLHNFNLNSELISNHDVKQYYNHHQALVSLMKINGLEIESATYDYISSRKSTTRRTNNSTHSIKWSIVFKVIISNRLFSATNIKNNRIIRQLDDLPKKGIKLSFSIVYSMMKNSN